MYNDISSAHPFNISWVEQHFAKRNSENKCTLKCLYWNAKPGETRDAELIRARPPPKVEELDWDTRIEFWLDPEHVVSAVKNAENQVQNTIFCRKGSHSLDVLRDQQMESSERHEHPSTRGDDQAGVDTPIGVPYTDKQILAMFKIGKQRGHIPEVRLMICSPQGTRGSEAWGMGGGGGGDYKSGGDEDAD
ncbi:hypothetical protein Tco_0746607, partial [Tanacetum coccineum]